METKNIKSRIILVILSLLIISACCKKTTTTAAKDYSKEGFSAAKVVKPELAGCDYILMMASVNYQPLNLPMEFKKDGVEVWVKYHKEKSQMSSCMMGEIISIDEINLKSN